MVTGILVARSQVNGARQILERFFMLLVLSEQDTHEEVGVEIVLVLIQLISESGFGTDRIAHSHERASIPCM